MATTKANLIANGEGWDFWQIGSEVYRASSGAEMDTYGLPMGRRWESSYDLFLHWHSAVYAWAPLVSQ